MTGDQRTRHASNQLSANRPPEPHRTANARLWSVCETAAVGARTRSGTDANSRTSTTRAAHLRGQTGCACQPAAAGLGRWSGKVAVAEYGYGYGYEYGVSAGPSDG